MSFVKYKIGDIQQSIQFDETINNPFFLKKFSLDFSLPLKGGSLLNPTVKISKKSPNNIQEWEKSNYKFHNDIIIYTKFLNNKLYFHIQIKNSQIDNYQYKFSCSFRTMLVSNILQNDILNVHALLLNNGDIIFGQCCDGKTTLFQRINKNNNLKALCDDDVIIDLKNESVYPIPSMWIYSDDPLFKFKPIKINRIIQLKQDSNQQSIKIIPKEEWIKKFFNCSKLFLQHPFLIRDQQFDETKNQKWINCRKGLEQLVQNKIKFLIQKYIKKYKLWCITTNTSDITKKFEILEDKI